EQHDPEQLALTRREPRAIQIDPQAFAVAYAHLDIGAGLALPAERRHNVAHPWRRWPRRARYGYARWRAPPRKEEWGVRERAIRMEILPILDEGVAEARGGLCGVLHLVVLRIAELMARLRRCGLPSVASIKEDPVWIGGVDPHPAWWLPAGKQHAV